MTARGYSVNGVQLVNTGGENCDACGRRKAIGSSVGGHLLCARCAGLHSVFADELAQEKAESERRRAAKALEQERQRIKGRSR